MNWIDAVSDATPKTYTKNESSGEDTDINSALDQVKTYVSYRFVLGDYAYLRKTPSSLSYVSIHKKNNSDKDDGSSDNDDDTPVDASTNAQCIYFDEVVETCSGVASQEIVHPDTGNLIKWMQLVSHDNYWVPMHTPDGIDMFEIISDNQSPPGKKDIVVKDDGIISDDDAVASKDIALEEGRAHQRQHRYSAAMKYDGDVESMLRIQQETMDFNPAFRVISCGEHSSVKFSNGIYFALPGYSVKVWAAMERDTCICASAMHLCVIDRNSGVIDFTRPYFYSKVDSLADISNGGAGRRLYQLTRELNELSEDKFIVVFTTGTPGSSSNRLQSGLSKALMRCGATKLVTRAGGIDHTGAYVLIGIPGCGKGNGYELVQGGTKEANIDVNFELTEEDGCPGWKICEVKQGVVSIDSCCSNNNILFSVFQPRDDNENKIWKEYQKKTMPSYFTLCRLESQEINSFIAKVCIGYNFYIVGRLLALLGLGHILTSVGRRAVYVVLWKLFMFVGLCLGYWTDELVELFDIHKHIRDMSIVWDKPFKRKSATTYETYRQAIAYNTSAKNDDNDGDTAPKLTAAQKFGSYFPSLPAWMTPDSGWLESGEKLEESEEMIEVQQEDSKGKLSADYSVALHAVVATRAVLLQAVPELSILSIYATVMSGTPIMVHSERLRANLPEFIISEPFVEARALEQELIDEQEWIRRANLTKDQYCVPNPKTKLVNGTIVKVARDEWDANELANEKHRERMQAIINMPSRIVDEWIVAINGSISYITESRAINFFINLYKFFLSVTVLLVPEEYRVYLMSSSLIVLFPYSIVTAFEVVLLIGRTLYITDDDLENALVYANIEFIYRWILRYTGSKKKTKSEAAAEATAVGTGTRDDGGEGRGAASSEIKSLRAEFAELTAEGHVSDSNESHSSSTIRDAITNTDVNACVYKDTEQPLSTNLDDSTNQSLGLEIAANLNSSEDESLNVEYHHLEQGRKDNDLGTEKDTKKEDTLDLDSLSGQVSDDVDIEIVAANSDTGSDSGSPSVGDVTVNCK